MLCGGSSRAKMGLLSDAGLLGIYERDVFGLNPLLDRMSQRGMPVDAATRVRVVSDVAIQRGLVLAKIRALVPAACCPTKVYKREPPAAMRASAHREGVMTTVTSCSRCQTLRVTRTHPCVARAEGTIETLMVLGEQWVVPQPFVPSPKGLLTYLQYKGYAVPKRDGRPTTDEAALRRLALKHEKDELFPLILQYRELDKLLGTYLGRAQPV